MEYGFLVLVFQILLLAAIGKLKKILKKINTILIAMSFGMKHNCGMNVQVYTGIIFSQDSCQTAGL
jgi:hypothetical protein